MPLTENTQYSVEFVTKPTFLNQNGQPEYKSRGLSYTITGQELALQSALCYSVGVITLPEIPNAMCEDSVLVWEAYRVETEVITQIILGAGGFTTNSSTVASVEGPQMYFWAVGGEPLDVVGVNPDPDKYKFDPELTVPKSTGNVAGAGAAKAQVTSPKYPIEAWTPDPGKNDNCRYFGRIIGGSQTPPVITFGNSSTTPLVDEYGVGPLCMHGYCYLTSVDLLGTVGHVNATTLPDSGANKRVLQTAMGRFFRVHFRQRRIKNPWTIEQMMSQFLRPKPPNTSDTQTGAEEVTMLQEKGFASVPPTVEGAVGYGNAEFVLRNGSLVYPDGQGGALNLSTKDKDTQ